MATKEARTPKSNAELRSALMEQITLLISYCEHYDRGELVFSKPMATALRVLLHHAGSSHSLLGQLNVRSGRFFSVAPPLNPKNLLTECNLVMVRLNSNGDASYLPLLHFLDPRSKRRPFPEWWTAPVVKGTHGRTMSRMDIVRAVADMDGGAHVDRSVTALYDAFRSGELLGWRMMIEGQPDTPIRSPQYGCIRAIAHELLLTLKEYAGWAFQRPYEPTLD